VKLELLPLRGFDEWILELPIGFHDGRIVFVGYGGTLYAPEPPYVLEQVDPDEHDVKPLSSKAARDNENIHTGLMRPSISVALRGENNGPVEWILHALLVEDAPANREPEEVQPLPRSEWFEANVVRDLYDRPDPTWASYRGIITDYRRRNYGHDGTDWSPYLRRQRRHMRLQPFDRDADKLPADEGPQLREETARIKLYRAEKGDRQIELDEGLPDPATLEHSRAVGDGRSVFAGFKSDGAEAEGMARDRGRVGNPIQRRD
jgi:hypothetical protein